MEIVYAREAFPTQGKSSIFLAGPSPRDTGVIPWRPEALKILEGMGYDGHVYVPEPRSGVWDKLDPAGKTEQIEWEDTALHRSDVILFWIPRDMESLPGLTTNDEWGFWKISGKVVLGAPPVAPHTNYQKHYGIKYEVLFATDLISTCRNALVRLMELNAPQPRSGGLMTVPSHIFATLNFQKWLKAQEAEGNRLEDCRVRFALWDDKGTRLVFWCLWVKLWIESEGRYKDNEVMFSRPDIATVVLHGPVPLSLGDTKIVLVSETRLAGMNGPVLECPSGSSHNESDTPLRVAQSEMHEETGLMVPLNRIVTHEARQLMATLSIHKSHLFSVELTPGDLEWFESQSGVVRGEAGSSERTTVVCTTVGKLLENPQADWSTVGMVLATVLRKAGC